MNRYKEGEISVVFVPIGKLNLDEVSKKLKLAHIHNIVSVPSWSTPLPTTPQRREDIREQILSAATEDVVIQNLRRSIQPKYQLKKQLGSGVLGQAFIAIDRQLQREVCIKLLAHKERYRDFQGFVSQVATDDHTNILTIYGAYLDADPPHLVRRYVKGTSLRSYLDERRGPLSARFVQTFLTTIGRAVIHAHDQGVSNLNLKPT